MITQAVDLLGVVLGIVFVFLSVRASRTLVGSAFRRYHYWMVAGAIVFTSSFIVDLIGTVTSNMDSFDSMHHILMLVAVVIFIITNLSLPREASQYLDLKDKDQKKGGGA